MGTAIFYPDSIRKTINLFGDLFNEIPVNRRNKNNIETYTVPINFGDKEKVLSFLRNNKKSQYKIKIPRLGFMLDAIDFDEERNVNPLTKFLSRNNSQFIFSPVPYTFTFILGIYADSTSDLFRIFEYIVPQYRKTRYVKHKEFEFTDGSVIERKIPVTLESTVNNMKVEDIGNDEQRILKLDLTFNVKGNIYNPITGIETNGNIDWRTNNTVNAVNGNVTNLIENIKIYTQEFESKYYDLYEMDLQTGDEIVTTTDNGYQELEN